MAEISPSIVILAAGKGTRMQSKLPKVLHAIGHYPLLWHVISAAHSLHPTSMTVVIGPQMEEVETYVHRVTKEARCVVQTSQLGTGHAVQAALPTLPQDQPVLVLYGDTPLLTPQTLKTLLASVTTGGHSLAILGFHAKDPGAYGRLIAEADTVRAIVEYQDANPKERAITLCNAGVMAIAAGTLHSLIGKVTNQNAKGEYYLTDLVAINGEQGGTCGLVMAEEQEVAGVNSRAQLAEAEAILQARLRKTAMESGVTLVQPDTIYLSPDTVFGTDVVLHPFVVIGPHVTLHENVTVHSFSHLSGATVHAHSVIGPFARLRPTTTLHAHSHIGNFVEVKNSTIGEGSKANHLSYIGDTTIGRHTNIGAGTITCNYDGFAKFQTTIGDECFIGSDSCLIAPVTIGDRSIIGAGSVITEDVPEDALALSRLPQHTVPEKAKIFRNKRKKS